MNANATAAGSGHEPPGYVLDFADEMDGTELDTSIWNKWFEAWNIRILDGNADKGLKVGDEDVLFKNRTVAQCLRSVTRTPGPYMQDMSDGTLKMRTYALPKWLERGFGYPYLASMISTEDSYALHHGYWEVRFRINRFGTGYHAAIWLLPDNETWPPEIDLFEIVGTDRRIYANGKPVGDHEELGVPGLSWVDGDALLDDWMTVGFLWTEDIMRWTINGETVREHAAFAMERPLYFITSWEVGGQWSGPPDRTTPWPGEIEIDYVRAWRPGEEAGAGVSD